MTQKGCFRNSGMYCGREFLDYGIKSKDKVLDIGGGHHPFKYATHILDSDNKEFDVQRSNQKIELRKGQTLINGTTDLLPEFKDKEFDFIHCSHIIEHIENLPQCLDEISRIGKRGFIAVPHYLFDFLQVGTVSGHKWFCDYKDDTLRIMKRLPSDYDNKWVSIWAKMMWNGQNVPLCMYWEGHSTFGVRFLWEIRFFWEDKIDYCLDDNLFPQLNIYREYVGGRDGRVG